MNTEINLNEEFGYNIYQTIIKYELRQNLEIGSWDGEGSTQCFVKAMDLLGGALSLDCVEVDKIKYEKLSERYLNKDYVKCHHNSSISYADHQYKNFDDVWNSKFNKIDKNLYSRDLIETWFNNGIASVKNNKGFLKSEKDKKNYDGVLIDGCEFTGYSEFLLLKDRTKVFFIDDVHRAFKCYQIWEELKADNNWVMITDLPNARNGASIFAKKNIL